MNSGNEPITEVDLHAYVDDQIEPERRITVEHYLAQHPEVAARVMADLRARDAMRFNAVGKTDPSPALLLAADRLRGTLARQRIARMTPKMAAVMAVGLLGWASGDSIDIINPGMARATPLLVDQAIESHKTALIRARLASQPETASLDIAEIEAATRIRLPKMPKQWKVIDVQLFPSDEGPSLQVTLDDGDASPVSLFAVAADTDAPKQPEVIRTAGETVVFWEHGDQSYALTTLSGDLSPRELDQTAERMAEATPG